MKYEDVKTPEQLLDFMNSNIKYGFEYEKEIYGIEDEMRFQNGVGVFWTLQEAEETVDSKYGIYFDQVELERDWFSKHGYEFKTIMVTMQVNDDHTSISHAFLVFKDDGKWHLFENALDSKRGIYRFNFLNEVIFFAINQFIDVNKQMIQNTDEFNFQDTIKIYEYSEDLTDFYFDEVMERIMENGKDLTGVLIVTDIPENLDYSEKDDEEILKEYEQ